MGADRSSLAGALLAVATEAARGAGAVLLDRYRAGARGVVRTKSSGSDLASDADLAAEASIRRLLDRARPGDAVLGEEGGGAGAAAPGGVRWIVDPLDGTTNFLHGVPEWSVSVACEDATGPLAGVVFDPLRDELHAAAYDGPLLLDGAPAAARAPRALSEALVATGFSYDAAERGRQGELLAALLPHVRDVRRLGSAALDLAWTACGRYDVYVERGIESWDIAAGTLLAERAGLEVRPLDPRPGLPSGIAVAAPPLLEQLARFDL